MKKLIILFYLLFSVILIYGQSEDRIVTITTTGSGSSFEDAKYSALRSAIEQAFGTFISSKTEILNDRVVADQIVSIANGNIQSFSILHESQFPGGSWSVTLRALVSVSKLTSFVEARGVEVEIKGSLFALNIKQQMLNEQGEINAVNEMVGLLHEPMQISFNYDIKSSTPRSIDEDSKNWVIPLTVTATTNYNIEFCANYCINILSALSLSYEEVTTYDSLNKIVFPVEINYKGATKIFYLRKKSSVSALQAFVNQWAYYTRLFAVQTEINDSSGYNFLINKIHNFDGNRIKTVDTRSSQYKREPAVKINFLNADQEAAIFSWKDMRTLSEIEIMTGYKVKPRGVLSKYKHGGIVVYENNGHGLVTSFADLEPMDLVSAKSACDNLILNGYSDWRLPTKEELNLLYFNLGKFGLGSFSRSEYWSSSMDMNNYAWKQYLNLNNSNFTNIYNTNKINIRKLDNEINGNYNYDSLQKLSVRAVRVF